MTREIIPFIDWFTKKWPHTTTAASWVDVIEMSIWKIGTYPMVLVLADLPGPIKNELKWKKKTDSCPWFENEEQSNQSRCQMIMPRDGTDKVIRRGWRTTKYCVVKTYVSASMEVLVLGGLAAAHRNPCPNGDHLPVFIPPELYFYGDTQFWGLQQTP